MYSKLYKFTIIRNPWERVISFYFSPHRNVTKWNKEDFRNFLPTVKPVRYYLSEYDLNQPDNLKQVSQNSLSVLNNINFVMRNEQL